MTTENKKKPGKKGPQIKEFNPKEAIHMTKSESNSDSVCQRRRECLTVSMNLKWNMNELINLMH